MRYVDGAAPVTLHPGWPGGTAQFEDQEEVSLFEQLVRVHKKVLEQRLLALAYRNRADKERLTDQLETLQQWLDELTRKSEPDIQEPEGSVFDG